MISASVASASCLNPGDLAIELGAGNDKVTVGTSTNTASADVVVFGNTYIDMGSGNAAVSIQSTEIFQNFETSHGAATPRSR